MSTAFLCADPSDFPESGGTPFPLHISSTSSGMFDEGGFFDRAGDFLEGLGDFAEDLAEDIGAIKAGINTGIDSADGSGSQDSSGGFQGTRSAVAVDPGRAIIFGALVFVAVKVLSS